MSSRPSHYYIRYRNAVVDNGDCDPSRLFDRQDTPSLPAARAFLGQCKKYAEIVERYNIRDVTPDGDPTGLLWEWDERQIADT